MTKISFAMQKFLLQKFEQLSANISLIIVQIIKNYEYVL